MRSQKGGSQAETISNGKMRAWPLGKCLGTDLRWLPLFRGRSLSVGGEMAVPTLVYWKRKAVAVYVELQ